MKVLHTVKYFYPSKGGMETAAHDIIKSVSQKNKEIEFTVFSNSNIPTLKNTKFEFENINVVKSSTPFIFKSQPLNLFYPHLRELFQDADIVHHHYPFPNLEFWILRNMDLLKNKKLIITWHANINNSRWSSIERIYNPLIEKILEIATYIVVTSPQLFENSILLKKYKNKIRIIPLTFNSCFIENTIPRKFPDGKKFNLLYVGKLRKYKGLEYLIEAVRELDVKLTIVGDGEEENQIRNLIKLHELNFKIEILKNLSLDDLKIKYKDSNLFILPSINEAEAFGIVQLEALANGLPVINTLLKSGVPFVSVDGVTGLTVPPKNSQDIKNAIKKIIENKDLYEKFSKNAILRVKEFSNEKIGENYKLLYFS